MSLFWSRKTAELVEGDIRIYPIAQDRPEFRRIYKVTVGDGFMVEIELWSWIFGRTDSSTVTQKNGKYISFDANAVADKIIDRELYPLVQDAVNRILAIDKAYIATKPSEFTDDQGKVWRRVD